MAKQIRLKSPTTGVEKNGYYGFSWTYLFFGFFVPLIRGELGVAALHLLFSMFTLGVWQIIVCFLYNKQYTIRLLEKGYQFNETGWNLENARAKLGVSAV